jgi:hypothetical protein
MRAVTRRAVIGGAGAAGVVKAFGADRPPRFTTKAMRQNASVRDVDTLLVLATDVSNSVIKERWEVQRSGYAAAFANEDVQKRGSPALAVPSACALSNGHRTISKSMWSRGPISTAAR